MLPSSEGEVSQVVDFLPAYQVERLTPAQKNGLAKAIDPHGFLALAPMVCHDTECPMFQKCPLVRLEITRPVGDDCPVESAGVRTWRDRLFAVLPKEEQADPYNVMLVNDIALLLLIEQRATIKMSKTGDIEQEIIVGHAPDGSELRNTDIDRGIQVLEKIGKRKTQLMAKLLATPQCSRSPRSESWNVRLKLKLSTPSSRLRSLSPRPLLSPKARSSAPSV
jgi:hypothetical protein